MSASSVWCRARASRVKQWKCLRICLAGCDVNLTPPFSLMYYSIEFGLCVRPMAVHCVQRVAFAFTLYAPRLSFGKTAHSTVCVSLWLSPTRPNEWFQLVTCQLSACVVVLFFFVVSLPFCRFHLLVLSFAHSLVQSSQSSNGKSSLRPRCVKIRRTLSMTTTTSTTTCTIARSTSWIREANDVNNDDDDCDDDEK